jgi:hypothetical protein
MVSGTAGFTGAADTILILRRDPNQLNGVLYVRGRDVIEREVAVQFEQDTGRWKMLGSAEDFRRSQERRAVFRALLEIGHPAKPAEIASCMGRTTSHGVRMLLLKMVRAGDLIRTEEGCYRAAGAEP